MKKIIFLFIAIIISACASPQVTVTSTPQTSEVSETSEVLTPTPTLHPQFIAWQEFISSSARYTLTADGLIQENGIAIAGLQVDSNGVMTLTVNNEKIILTVNDVTFDEDGIKINGYELQNGAWVEAVIVLTPEQQLELDMQFFNLSPDKFNVGYDADGKIELRNNSGKLVYWDGRWSTDVVIDMVKATNDCQATEFVHQPGTNSVIPEQNDVFAEYRLKLSIAAGKLIANSSDPLPAKAFRTVPFPGLNQCWGLWLDDEIMSFSPTYLAWTKDNGEVEVIKVFDPKVLQLK